MRLSAYDAGAPTAITMATAPTTRITELRSAGSTSSRSKHLAEVAERGPRRPRRKGRGAVERGEHQPQHRQGEEHPDQRGEPGERRPRRERARRAHVRRAPPGAEVEGGDHEVDDQDDRGDRRAVAELVRPGERLGVHEHRQHLGVAAGPAADQQVRAEVVERPQADQQQVGEDVALDRRQHDAGELLAASTPRRGGRSPGTTAAASRSPRRTAASRTPCRARC